jgi:small multidrug resistance family-3 protein
METAVSFTPSQTPAASVSDSTTSDAGSTGAASVESFQWTVLLVLQVVSLFIAAGFAEIGGGWLVWQAIRQKKPYWWAILGSMILVVYGFVPTLQPSASFGRIYAVYGGFYIVMSFLAGWWLDGDRPDKGDVIGGLVALGGVCVVMFWPRTEK